MSLCDCEHACVCDVGMTGMRKAAAQTDCANNNSTNSLRGSHSVVFIYLLLLFDEPSWPGTTWFADHYWWLGIADVTD